MYVVSSNLNSYFLRLTVYSFRKEKEHGSKRKISSRDRSLEISGLVSPGPSGGHSQPPRGQSMHQVGVLKKRISNIGTVNRTSY